MFMRPEDIIRAAGIEAGMHVAELGSGSGFYTVPIARAVGGAGRVYAVDIQKDLLLRIKAEAAREGLANIDIIWGDAEAPGGTKLAERSADMVVASNLFFQLENRVACVKEIRRIVRPGGMALVIDWTDAVPGVGPAPLQVVHPAQMKALFEEAGFALAKEIPSGDHHYGMLFSYTG